MNTFAYFALSMLFGLAVWRVMGRVERATGMPFAVSYLICVVAIVLFDTAAFKVLL